MSYIVKNLDFHRQDNVRLAETLEHLQDYINKTLVPATGTAVTTASTALPTTTPLPPTPPVTPSTPQPIGNKTPSPPPGVPGRSRQNVF